MEVHQHSHTPRKKWTHYFWEFLMLFLAVFCGFLAEYQLEHTIEKGRERQFIRSLMNDLQADTANIGLLNAFRLNISHRSDSLFNILTSEDYAHRSFEIYYHGSILSRRAFFYSADGTIQQLKNSGGLRLISKTSIADSIKSYDVLYRSILQLQTLEEEQVMAIRQVAAKIFSAHIIRKFMLKELTSLSDSIKLKNVKLKQDTPELINELSNTLNYRSGNSYWLYNQLELLKTKAEQLIGLIKKEYHLSERTP